MEKEIKRKQLEFEEEQRQIKEKKRTDEFSRLRNNCAITRAELENANMIIADMESDAKEDENVYLGLSRLRDTYKELEKKLNVVENVDAGSEYELFHTKNKEVNELVVISLCNLVG